MDESVFNTYVRFVKERHRIWERRQQGGDPGQPLTLDPVLRAKKFTNVYRILDVGTQFVCEELLESATPEERLVRAFLYRYTNRPEPWVAFREEFGRYPTRADLHETLPEFWLDYKLAGNPIFGNAYRMFVGQENAGEDRLSWMLRTAQNAVGYGHDQIVDDFLEADPSAEARLAILKRVPRCANFMGMQIVTDFGYLDPHYDEDEYVVAGPGSTKGAREIDRSCRPVEMIHICHLHLSRMANPVLLVGRTPSLMDVQNTLCEFSKYVRYLRLGVPDRPYRPAHPGPQPRPWLPPHWRGQAS